MPDNSGMLDIDIVPVISPQALADLRGQFSDVSEQGIADAFDRLNDEQRRSRSNAVFDEMSGAAARRRSQNMHGNLQTGIGAAGRVASGNVTGAIGMAGPWGAAIAGTIGVFQQLTSTIKGFVAVANPEVVELFDDAVRDISGVIGKTLTPVVRHAVPYVQLFGDLLASLVPSGQDLEDAFKDLAVSVHDLKVAIDPWIPVLKKGGGAAADTAKQTLISKVDPSYGIVSGLFGKLFHKAMNPPGGIETKNIKSARNAARKGHASYDSIEGAGRSFQLAGFNSIQDQAAQANIDSAKHLANIDAKTQGHHLVPASVGNS